MGIIQKPTELRGVFDLNYHSHVLRFILKDNKTAQNNRNQLIANKSIDRIKTFTKL